MSIANPPDKVSPRGHVVVTPDDDNDLPKAVCGLRVGTTAGNIKVTDVLGVTTVIPNVAVGEVIPGQFVKVWADGTDAVGITGFIQ